MTRALRLRHTLRRTRAALSLNVVPSLSLNAFVRPTFGNSSGLNEESGTFVLGVTVSYPSVLQRGGNVRSKLKNCRSQCFDQPSL